ncbi:agmatine deiminase family protein [Chloroflexus sp.]|uniref:agmatine deiminase family protein n=1 Tax=Chloroflexus sp. TaxID=1904827 RepID=UPI002ADE2981|nr:agmatine deiminase family protein [Chloroflexus sp.]
MATPAELGYRMPAEWEPHQATWLSWPHKEESWPGIIDRIWPVYARFVAELAHGETVHINVNDAAMADQVRSFLAEAGAVGDIRLHEFPTNDAWCRDHGAIFVVRDTPAGRELAATDWEFNAWGGKYPPYDLDNQIPARMAAYLGVPRFCGGMVLEGGSIDVDGNGLLLTSEQCLLNPNRNPHLDRAAIEQRLREMLGVHTILWLGEGIVGDDTDGHIDDLARFVAPGVVVTVVEDDPLDENYHVLQDNLRRLQLMRDAAGRPLTVLTIPMPPPVVFQGQRLPASYANFYIANHAVIVPTFNHPNDQRACAVLQQCFPDRRVVGIEATDVIWGLGSWHCLSQQVPAGLINVG